MVEVIVFLKHKETLITFEHLLYMLDVRSHFDLDLTFFGLELICPLIEGKDQEVDGKA